MKRLIHVAYADDHSIVRKGIISLLEENNSIKVILEAENGRILLDKMNLHNLIPDVCLIDINMPVMNGFELLNEIKKKWPNIPCIILSAYTEEHNIIEMIKLGANGYLNKSCDIEEMYDAIHKVLIEGYFYNHFLSEEMIKSVVEIKKNAPKLNDREIELLKHVCSDLSYADIALKLGTTFKTIDGIRMRLCSKLHINSRVGLVLAAIRLGYYTIEPQYSYKDKKQ